MCLESVLSVDLELCHLFANGDFVGVSCSHQGFNHGFIVGFQDLLQEA